jgi:hypothetical protein
MTVRTEDLRIALDEAAGPSPPAAPAYEGVLLRAMRARRRRRLAGTALALVAGMAVATSWWAVREGDDEERVATAPASPRARTEVTEVPAAVAMALDAWATFPVSVSPRPVVASYLVNAPASGFPSEDTKNAFESGQFRLATAVPDGPAEAGGIPLIVGEEILRRLRTGGSPGPRSEADLTITSIRLGSASFRTDRGLSDLPAWLITFRGIAGPAQVMAVAEPALFTPPPRAEVASLLNEGSVTVEDERKLTVGFTGSAPGGGPCSSEYALDVYPTDRAVALVVRELDAPSGGTAPGSEPVFCTSEGHSRQVSATLDHPLGARVVIDGETAAPMVVTP